MKLAQNPQRQYGSIAYSGFNVQYHVSNPKNLFYPQPEDDVTLFVDRKVKINGKDRVARYEFFQGQCVAIHDGQRYDRDDIHAMHTWHPGYIEGLDEAKSTLNFMLRNLERNDHVATSVRTVLRKGMGRESIEQKVAA